jgi:hypothetical protein
MYNDIDLMSDSFLLDPPQSLEIEDPEMLSFRPRDGALSLSPRHRPAAVAVPITPRPRQRLSNAGTPTAAHKRKRNEPDNEPSQEHAFGPCVIPLFDLPYVAKREEEEEEHCQSGCLLEHVIAMKLQSKDPVLSGPPSLKRVKLEPTFTDAVMYTPKKTRQSGSHQWLPSVFHCVQDRKVQLAIQSDRICQVTYYPKCTAKSPSPRSQTVNFGYAGVDSIPMMLHSSRMHSGIKSLLHLDRFVLHLASGRELTINGRDGRAQVFACRILDDGSLLLVSAMNVHNRDSAKSKLRRKTRTVTLTLLSDSKLVATEYCTIRVFESLQNIYGISFETILDDHDVVLN